MDLMPVVSVRGSAVLQVEPEIAVLDVTVAARDKDRDKTLARLDERSSAVLTLLESYGDAVERVETAGVRIGPEFKDGRPGERIAGYSAVVRHSVTVCDFTRLGDLLARLAEGALAEVNGPWWRLRPDTPAHRDARVAAAEDAVVRAREYAAALGSRLVGLVELADVGLLGDSAPETPVRAAMPVSMPPAAMRSAPGAAPPVTFDLEPMRQVVRASVEARFRMDQPPPERLA